mgnify:CR=1 FL=1
MTKASRVIRLKLMKIVMRRGSLLAGVLGALVFGVLLLPVTPAAAQETVTEEWVARYNGPGNRDDSAYAIAVDGSGNVYVTGYSYNSSTHNDYVTVKYDTNGNELWTARYNGPGNSLDVARAMAVDDSGNVYVTGESLGSGTDRD